MAVELAPSCSSCPSCRDLIVFAAGKEKGGTAVRLGLVGCCRPSPSPPFVPLHHSCTLERCSTTTHEEAGGCVGGCWLARFKHEDSDGGGEVGKGQGPGQLEPFCSFEFEICSNIPFLRVFRQGGARGGLVCVKEGPAASSSKANWCPLVEEEGGVKSVENPVRVIHGNVGSFLYIFLVMCTCYRDEKILVPQRMERLQQLCQQLCNNYATT